MGARFSILHTKKFNEFQNSGQNCLCFTCRTYEKSEKCKICKKTIHKQNKIINCSKCNSFFHSCCSGISFTKFKTLFSWTCDTCMDMPFSTLDDEEFHVTLQAKRLPFGDHVLNTPSLSIQSLLDNISGSLWNNEGDNISDLTQSKYYTPSEFFKSKSIKRNKSLKNKKYYNFPVYCGKKIISEI